MSLNPLDVSIDLPQSDQTHSLQSDKSLFDSSPAIRYLTIRCGDRSLAEDITQDALLTILTREDLRTEWTSLHLLFRVALNELSNQRRKKRGRAAYLTQVPAAEISGLSESKHPNLEIAIDVRDALARLAARERNLIIRYWDGYTYKEMAEEQGVSDGALRMRLKRAKDRFAEELYGYPGRRSKECRSVRQG